MEAKARKRISFWFRPYEEDKGSHAIEKEDSQGNKRRYLKGITSGIGIDGHGERMTQKCINGMQEQANKGEILLYEGQHGVNFVDDIGRLVKSDILPTGDWLTTYRLYDELDGFQQGSNTVEKADKLWKQLNGLPPYERKKPRGFSIEGWIPDNGILEMDEETGTRTQIDSVELDGVIVTPRPSYKTSVITAICKALGELTPDKKIHVSENIRGLFINMIADEEIKQSFYSKKFKLFDALDESIESIMSEGREIKDRLNLLMGEFSTILIQLVLDHQGIYRRPPDEPDVPEQGAIDVAKAKRLHLLKSIQVQLKAFCETKTVKKVNKKNKEQKHGRNSNKRFKSRRKTNT